MNKILVIFLFISSFVFGQHEDEYWHKIEGVVDQWHELEIPVETYANGREDFSDYRIYGVSQEGDTIEIPYLTRENKTIKTSSNVLFDVLNQTSDDEFKYITYELRDGQKLNHINLNIDEKDFDHRILLEGSNDQKKWFTVLEDYRILSISIEYNEFYFADLNFPTIEYKYVRLRLPKENLTLRNAYLVDRIEEGGRYKKHHVPFRIEEESDRKRTLVFIDLPYEMPLSSIEVNFADTVDYYRHYTVYKRTDSVFYKEEWHDQYRKAAAGTFSSIASNDIALNSEYTDKLKIEIYNHNDRPLDLRNVSVQANRFSLVGRFEGNSNDYYLSYGGKKGRPIYDIAKFQNLVPEELKMLSTGEAKYYPITEEKDRFAIFDSKWWIWGLMIIIIAVLGIFTFKMMKDS